MGERLREKNGRDTWSAGCQEKKFFFFYSSPGNEHGHIKIKDCVGFPLTRVEVNPLPPHTLIMDVTNDSPWLERSLWTRTHINLDMLIWSSESSLSVYFSEVSLIRDNQGKETVWLSKGLIIKGWKVWLSPVIKVLTTALPLGFHQSSPFQVSNSTDDSPYQTLNRIKIWWSSSTEQNLNVVSMRSFSFSPPVSPLFSFWFVIQERRWFLQKTSPLPSPYTPDPPSVCETSPSSSFISLSLTTPTPCHISPP